MGLLVHGSLFVLAAAVASAVLTDDWQLFTLHPILMTLAAIGVTEGTYYMQRNLTSAEKSRGLRLHRYAHGLGLCAATAGFSIIYCTKEIYNKPHLATWHGMIGLMGIIWMSVQAVMGNLLIFCPGLFGGPTQVRQYYRMHRVFGYGAVVTMWGATALGMMSNWMLRHLNYPWLGWTLGALALIGLLRRISLAAVRLR